MCRWSACSRPAPASLSSPICARPRAPEPILTTDRGTSVPFTGGNGVNGEGIEGAICGFHLLGQDRNIRHRTSNPTSRLGKLVKSWFKFDTFIDGLGGSGIELIRARGAA